MYSQRRKKPAITALERRDITDYVRSFVWHARGARGQVLTARHRGEAESMKGLMNKPENTTYKSVRDLRDGDYFWHHQEVDFISSNLGRGFIFYFVCNGCRRRVKYLYEYSSLRSPLCRICCRLQYPQPSRSARRLSRLIRQAHLSGEAKSMLIKRTGITVGDVTIALKGC